MGGCGVAQPNSLPDTFIHISYISGWARQLRRRPLTYPQVLMDALSLAQTSSIEGTAIDGYCPGVDQHRLHCVFTPENSTAMTRQSLSVMTEIYENITSIQESPSKYVHWLYANYLQRTCLPIFDSMNAWREVPRGALKDRTRFTPRAVSGGCSTLMVGAGVCYFRGLCA